MSETTLAAEPLLRNLRDRHHKSEFRPWWSALIRGVLSGRCECDQLDLDGTSARSSSLYEERFDQVGGNSLTTLKFSRLARQKGVEVSTAEILEVPRSSQIIQGIQAGQ